jgi:hypothetical protein
MGIVTEKLHAATSKIHLSFDFYGLLATYVRC